MTQVAVPPRAGTSTLARPPGPRGQKGDQGAAGWSPILASVEDGARRVLRIADWVGGQGAKPATGLYLGVTGLVSNIGDAVDMRGAAGLDGVNGWSPTFAAVTDGERRVLQVIDWLGGSGIKPAVGKFVGAPPAWSILSRTGSISAALKVPPDRWRA